MSTETTIPDNWNAPEGLAYQIARTALSGWRFVTAPQFHGAERVPRDRPCMFISNHTLMGMLDTPLLILGIYEHTGHYPRSLGDHFHFVVPGWRDLLTHYGAVEGTRENCRALMSQGHSLIIFPGGGREVFKHKGEAYQLIWGKRSGFARLAREAGYPIVPVAAVGAEECYRILLDEKDLMKTSVGETVKKHSPRSDVAMPPLIVGAGGTLLPIPQRFYFMFGDPIESTPYQGREDEDEAIFELREEVRVALQAQIDELLTIRDRDPDRPLRVRVRRALSRLSPIR